MKKEIFKNEYDKLVVKELANKVVSILLAVAMVIMSLVTYKLYSEQRTIIKTTDMSKEFWVTSNQVSESYLEQMGQYISSALFNVSPNTASKQFELILDLASPSFYQSLKAELANQRKYILENGITVGFELKDFKFEKDHIVVNGTKRNEIGGKVIDKKDTVFKIFFEVQNGRFYITNFEIK